MKAYGYIRVSTDGQAKEGVSLEAQEGKIRAWCQVNGYELAGVYVETMSGGRADNRPQLQAALAEVCRGKGVLVVYSLSRLARSTTDAIAISQRLEKCGADLASLTERIDTTSAAGKMVFRMLAVLAEFERDQIKERTVAAMSHLRRKGMRISRVVPFGYDLAEDGQTLTANTSEQAGVALMSRLRGAGKSYAEIAEQLGRRGVRTKAGGSWEQSAVRKILARAQKVGAVKLAA
jgi:DNA invertase Pin-like site-specific DNA recombinase